ncbi:thioredoxin-disulfide reductase [uncultured Dysosmobacter sp.]|uniref:thioredoxin-disulfide reductase n=1 Tax=uncultured Dysosmobacter sp. TaxID=2591384 RepID=UPI002622456B|nr:thioredoxin-disulfide reductase [uncultured Dysosmobacter sp.]
MEQQIYDLIILGSGCAGLTAGIYAGRAQLRTLILENGALGGQAATTNEIGNYPGVPDASGPELMQRMLEQARSFGAEFQSCTVHSVQLAGERKRVETSAGIFEAYAIILATGATPRKLGFEGEAEFRGRGVGYCATCDGFFFQDKDVFVIGGGNSAAEEALYLTRFAKKVTVLVRKDAFRCEKAVAQKVLSHPKIEVKFNTELIRAYGDETLKGAEMRNNRTGEITTYTVPEEDGMFGIFVFVGYQPASELFQGQVELDGDGYIQTDDRLETNLPGVYAAGDVRPKELRQLVTATADGAIAATQAGTYILRKKEKLGIAPAQARKDLREETSAASQGVLTEALRSQIRPVFRKLERDVVLVMAGEPDDVKTQELKDLLGQLCEESPHLSLRAYPKHDRACPVAFERWPAFALCGGDGQYSGVKFSGIPGGHEFNSLIFAIYHYGGPGQEMDAALRARIASIQKPVQVQIAVSLSCHFCPEVVIAAQRIAMLNPQIEAEMVDVGLFHEFQRKYRLMSVPALIVQGKSIHFGPQSMAQILDVIESAQ